VGSDGVTVPLAALLGVEPGGGDWREQALCAQIGGDVWFPESGGSVRKAKAVCNGGGGRPPCPVRQECLEAALDRNDRYGIWGGLTDRERRVLRRSPDYPAARAVREITHGTRAGYVAHRRRGEKACQACLAAERRRPRGAA
jgi:WhiB family redox-sensing transcriptional regulator